MIERRSIWGVLIGLTICISIWRISVQEPYMLAEYGYNNNINIATGSVSPQMAAAFYQPELQQQQSQQIYGGKHLLARKVHDISDEEPRLGVTNTTPHINTERAQLYNAQNTTTHTQQPQQINATNTATPNRKQTSPLTAAYSSHSQNVLLLDERFNNKTTNTKSATKVKSSSSKNSYSSSGKLSLVTSIVSSSHQATQNTTSQMSVTPAIKTTNLSTIETLRMQLPPEDAQQLIDLHNFDYIMNQPACSDNVAALILVHTAPGNYMKRLLLRKTWGQYPQLDNTPLRLIFLLGAVSNKSLQYQLEQENNIFGDMVQGNFMDTYRNLTYKHAMVLKWFVYNCARAQILIKMDDDVFLNTKMLLKYFHEQQHSIEDELTGNANNISQATLNASQIVPELSKNSSGGSLFVPSSQFFRHPQNLLFCKPSLRSLVKRSYRSKWRVSKREYSNRYYPPYCPGYFITYSADVVWRLYKAAQTSEYFWIDDVHVTGTLAKQENITITPAETYMMTALKAKRIIQSKVALSKLDFIFTWPDISPEQIDELWNALVSEEEEDISDNIEIMNAADDADLVASHSYEGFR